MISKNNGLLYHFSFLPRKVFHLLSFYFYTGHFRFNFPSKSHVFKQNQKVIHDKVINKRFFNLHFFLFHFSISPIHFFFYKSSRKKRLIFKYLKKKSQSIYKKKKERKEKIIIIYKWFNLRGAREGCRLLHSRSTFATNHLPT